MWFLPQHAAEAAGDHRGAGAVTFGRPQHPRHCRWVTVPQVVRASPTVRTPARSCESRARPSDIERFAETPRPPTEASEIGSEIGHRGRGPMGLGAALD